MSDKKVNMEDIVSLCKRRGFIYQGSEVYGGLAGTWDYGPLGVALKRSIMNLWWKTFVDDRDDMYGVDAAILMNQKVWQASGHVDTFTDPMIECTTCNTRFREDQFLPGLPKSSTDGLWQEKWVDAYRVVHGFSDQDDLGKAIKATQTSFIEKTIVCPACIKPSEFTKPQRFNMMLKTVIGPKYFSVEPKDDETLDTDSLGKVGFKNKNTGKTGQSWEIKDQGSELSGFMFYDKNSLSYLRPETAQGIFTNYKNIVDSFYPDLPFGVAQIGKAFRNEISPRDFVFRSREFEQMEIEYFIDPENWEDEFEKWVNDIKSFLKSAGIPDSKVHELEVPEDDRAHYSKRTIDFEFDYPIGRKELLGLAYRTDFDLKNIQENSGKSMEYRTKDGKKSFVPHVLEPSFGVERLLMAILVSSYAEEEVNGEKRVVLKLKPELAPYRFAVSPLLKNKQELVEKAREVYQALKKKHGNIIWDDNGNIGKRYRRQDEIGTPECIVIDFQTLEDDTVTIRDRDTTDQKRVSIKDMV